MDEKAAGLSWSECRGEVLEGRAAAALSATHVDVCNERVRVDVGKHFIGPHDAAQTASSQTQCFR